MFVASNEDIIGAFFSLFIKSNLGKKTSWFNSFASISLGRGFTVRWVKKGCRIEVALPPDHEKEIHQIIVNRRGEAPRAYMKTEKVTGFVEPNKTYLITKSGPVLATDNTVKPVLAKHQAVTPKHICIRGRWLGGQSGLPSDSNILGENGSFYIEENFVGIPQAHTPPPPNPRLLWGVLIKSWKSHKI